MRIFISYSRQDFPLARAIHDGLQAAGHQPWLDLLEISPGENWTAAIDRAISSAELFLLVASPFSLASTIVQAEWRQARKLGCPVLLGVVQGLPTSRFIDALGLSDEALVEQLEWLDLRKTSQNSAAVIQGWLDGSLPAQRGLPPEAESGFRAFLNILPGRVRIYALAQALLSLISLGFTFGMVVWYFKIQTYMYGVFPLVLSSSYLYPIVASLNLLLAGFSLFGLVRSYRVFLRQFDRFDFVYNTAFLAIPLLLSWNLWPFRLSLFSFGPLLSNLLWRMLPFPWEGILACSVILLFILILILQASREYRTWRPIYLRERQEIITSPADTGPDAIPMEMLVLKPPIQQVCIVGAREDRGFQGLLEKALKTVDIQSHSAPPDPGKDSLLILLISPWLKRVAGLNEAIRLAGERALPILPVLLEDAEVSTEINHRNWIDGRVDLQSAVTRVIEVLQGRPHQLELADGTAPLGRRSRRNPVFPKAARPMLVMLGVALVLKAIFFAYILPILLFEIPGLSAPAWAALAGMLLGFFLELFLLFAILYRRISSDLLSVLLLVVLLPLGGVIFLLLNQPVLLDRVYFVFALLVADGLPCITLSRMRSFCRWLPYGFRMRLGGLEFARPFLLSVGIILLALLPNYLNLFSSGILTNPPVENESYEGQDGYVTGGTLLIPGDPLNVRIRPGFPDRWLMRGTPGDLVTIQLQRLTPDLSLSFYYPDTSGNTLFLSEGVGDVNDRDVYMIPASGEHILTVMGGWREHGGLYRIVYQVEEMDRRPITCGQTLEVNQLPGEPFILFALEVTQGEQITLSTGTKIPMPGNHWPAVRVFGPDFQPALYLLLNTVMDGNHPIITKQTGAYSILVYGSYPEDGYVLSVSCE